MKAVRIERVIDLPRDIVWAALVDPVLVGGWLHPTERLVSGTVASSFVEPDSAADAVLEVASPRFGFVRVSLGSLPGGTRGEATELRLVVRDEWGRHRERVMLWELRIDQLEDVLRGHPVNWASWSSAHRAQSAAASDESAHRRAR